jgi:hypothetical protein
VVDCRFQWSNKCASHYLVARSLNNLPIVRQVIRCSSLGGGMTCGTIVVGRTLLALRRPSLECGAACRRRRQYARGARLASGETRYSSPA